MRSFGVRRLARIGSRVGGFCVPSSTRLPIVMYHGINDVRGRYNIPVDAFKQQLDLLTDECQVIPLRAVPQALREPTSGRLRVVLTFDDAYTDFAENALPAMHERELPSTVFVPSAFMGKANTWDSDPSLGAGRPILSAPEIRELAMRDHVEIGSHSMHHFRMSTLAAEDMEREARGSRETLEELVGQPILSFAYPFGQLDDFSAASTQVLAQAGYALAVTTHWGIRHDPNSPFALRRIHFRAGDGPDELRAKLAGEDDWRTVKELGGYAWRRFRRRLVPAAREAH